MAKKTKHEITVVVEAMTEAAIGIPTSKHVPKNMAQSKNKLIWLPLSQIEMETDFHRVGDTVRVLVPEWLLIDKGLEWMIDA